MSFTHLIFVLIQADTSIHGELPRILCELVHLVIEGFCITLTLLDKRLNVSICRQTQSNLFQHWQAIQTQHNVVHHMSHQWQD